MVVPPKTESTLIATRYVPQIEELLSKHRSSEMAQPMVTVSQALHCVPPILHQHYPARRYRKSGNTGAEGYFANSSIGRKSLMINTAVVSVGVVAS